MEKQVSQEKHEVSDIIMPYQNLPFRELLQRGSDNGLHFGRPSPWSRDFSKEKLRAFEERLTNTLAECTEKIKSALISVKQNKWIIARELYFILESGAYTRAYEAYFVAGKTRDKYYPNLVGGCGYSSNASVLIWYANVTFGICRTELYNLLDVYETYVGVDGEPNEFAARYPFWQLVEMLPLTQAQREAVEPLWSRERLRDYKKSLKIQPAGQSASVDAVKPLEVEAVEPEIPFENPEYARFKDWTKAQLIDKILELERKLSNRTY